MSLYFKKAPKIISGIVLALFTFVNSAFALSPEETDQLKDLNFYKDLPVGDLDVHEADNSWATVVFFPQYHKAPGSSVKNKKNDKAEVTQNEIYEIIKSIMNRVPIKLVMVEGKLKGEVPKVEKEKVKKKIEDLKKLKDKPKNDKKVTEKKRELSLVGAPIKLWAEGKEMILVGSENKKTLDESREIVKEHLYLQEQLSGKTSGLEKSFSDETVKKLKKLKDLKAKMKDKKKSGKTENKENLKEKMKKNEEKIQDVIIDKRNKETAENFAQALKKYDENAGILEFGAGHEAGLIKEFNRLGIDVIVIKTTEVERLKK